MNWLRRLFYGRYGSDQLGLALVIASLVLSLISRLIPFFWVSLPLYLLAIAALVFSFVRMFSKNLLKRSQENLAFLKFFGTVKNWMNRRKERVQNRKTHRYYRCPQCKKELRVPKGKGKIQITCPHCRHEFIKKT